MPPDRAWLAYVVPDSNTFRRIHLYHVSDGQLAAAIELFKKKIAEEPVPPLEAPPGKDLSLRP